MHEGRGIFCALLPLCETHSSRSPLVRLTFASCLPCACLCLPTLEEKRKKTYSCLNLDTTATSSVEPLCLASAESTRSGLATILDKVKRVYFQQLHPETIHEMSPKSPENIRKYFQPYDPSPNAIKGRTDEAMKLYRELKALKINKKLLKLRERKAVHMASAILLNNYGWNPYNQDYYAGEWLLGPNLLCWEPVCNVFPNLNGVLPHFKPKNVADLETLKGLIEKYSLIFDRYVENWKLGVRTGYVRTYKACKVGVHVLKNQKYKGMETEQGLYRLTTLYHRNHWNK